MVEVTDVEQATLPLKSDDHLGVFNHVAHKWGSQWVQWKYVLVHAMKKFLAQTEKRLGG